MNALKTMYALKMKVSNFFKILGASALIFSLCTSATAQKDPMGHGAVMSPKKKHRRRWQQLQGSSSTGEGKTFPMMGKDGKVDKVVVP